MYYSISKKFMINTFWIVQKSVLTVFWRVKLQYTEPDAFKKKVFSLNMQDIYTLSGVKVKNWKEVCYQKNFIKSLFHCILIRLDEKKTLIWLISYRSWLTFLWSLHFADGPLAIYIKKQKKIEIPLKVVDWVKTNQKRHKLWVYNVYQINHWAQKSESMNISLTLLNYFCVPPALYGNIVICS